MAATYRGSVGNLELGSIQADRVGGCRSYPSAMEWNQCELGRFLSMTGGGGGGLICLKRIYNFWCSMLVFTPFALCFVTLRGVFMWFPELTYWQDAIVPVPCFLLFLCFRKATQEIFSELDETSFRSLIFPGSFQRAEEEAEWGHEGPTHQGSAAQPLAAPPRCEEPLAAPWRCPFAYIKPRDGKPLRSRQISRKSSAAPPPPLMNFGG
jgi:hypothetical protein